MFCMKCGKQLPDEAVFCMYCGTKLGEMGGQILTQSQAKFVQAKCTNCGAALEVDPTQEAAICKFCNTPFIVQKAINNYNITASGNMNINGAVINIHGNNADNLLKRAKEFEDADECAKALQYYEKVLDLDADNEGAREGIERINTRVEEYVYRKCITYEKGYFNRRYGKLTLLKDELIHEDDTGVEYCYDLSKIKLSKPGETDNIMIFKDQNESTVRIFLTGDLVLPWYKDIIGMQTGHYPEIPWMK